MSLYTAIADNIDEFDVLFVAFTSLLFISALVYAFIAHNPQPTKLYYPVSHIELPVKQPITTKIQEI